jgi:GNAT superfamily N-acetyltransferase
MATPLDEAAIARICLLTGADGGDATGLFADDRALADVYAVPYLYGPECVALAWDVDGGVRGYVLGAVDTLAFQGWFATDWWPSLPARTPRTRDDEWLLPSAADPGRLVSPVLERYPAHLHIDLLPDQQGRGAGRQLIEAFCSAAADAGAPGVHLVASANNPFAQGFYPRVGFHEIARTDTTVTFAREL